MTSQHGQLSRLSLRDSTESMTVREKKAESGHPCVTLVDFPQLGASFCEVDDGHNSFNDEGVGS